MCQKIQALLFKSLIFTSKFNFDCTSLIFFQAEANVSPMNYVDSAFDKQARPKLFKSGIDQKTKTGTTNKQRRCEKIPTENEVTSSLSVKEKILFFNQSKTHSSINKKKMRFDSITSGTSNRTFSKNKFCDNAEKNYSSKGPCHTHIKFGEMISDTNIKEKIAYFSSKESKISRQKASNKSRLPKPSTCNTATVLLNKPNGQFRSHYENNHQIYDSLQNAYKMKTPVLAKIQPAVESPNEGTCKKSKKSGNSRNQPAIELKSLFIYSNENKVTSIFQRFGRLKDQMLQNANTFRNQPKTF